MTTQKPRTIAAAAIVVIAIILAAIGPYIVPYDPERPTADVLRPPSAAHLLGTDASGIDVLSVVLAAFRVDILIAIVSVGISLTVGIALGAISGYTFNGSRLAQLLAALILRALDLVQSIPVFILALAIVGMVGQSIQNVVIAVAFVNLPIFARLTRTSIRGIEPREFVSASRTIGVREVGILGWHVLPNSLDSTIANASIAIGSAILLTAGLSFLGAGVRPPTPEWGAEIATGANYLITGEWWISVSPGILLAIVVLGFALIGDDIRVRLQRARREALGGITEAEQAAYIAAGTEPA
jgi:peptide/nickel transport system permease protein